ncbi:hypothetical protein [Xanthomonas sp. GPE 39]|uniref:hypothetical protein n=1 Tax=Xanthomonas sp. GPE 39 TaxID=1583099 RepID=UPI0019107B53|nr:hypothetical protein [Xanthomonas sp. GPE 39]
MIKIEEIAEYFFKYASAQGKSYSKFPLGTKVEEFGAPYIEIHESGKMAVVARDRGIECLRQETTSPEVLAKWVYELFNRKKPDLP